MRFSTVIFLIFAAHSASAQWTFDIAKLSEKGKVILSKIQNEKEVPSDTMGLRFWNLPKDYPLTVLRETLTIDELTELTNHSNPIVRCYGFKALTQRNEKAAFLVIKNHLQDTIEISTSYGCFRGREFVADFFVYAFRGDEAILHDSVHLGLLDSLLIFTPNHLEARSDAIRRAGETGKYYKRIKDVAINDKLAGAVIALANFKREEDITIIKDTRVTGKPFIHHQLATTFLAISQFPHPRFLRFLEDHLQSTIHKAPQVECRFLYEAIANYNNSHARDLLAQPFSISDSALRQKHLEELSFVLKRNSNPIYSGHRKQIDADLKH